MTDTERAARIRSRRLAGQAWATTQPWPAEMDQLRATWAASSALGWILDRVAFLDRVAELREEQAEQAPRLLMCPEGEAVLVARDGDQLIGFWGNDDEEGFNDALWGELAYRGERRRPDFVSRERSLERVSIRPTVDRVVELAELGRAQFELRRRVRELRAELEDKA